MNNVILDFSNKYNDFGAKGNNLKQLSKAFRNCPNIFIPETLIISKDIFKEIISLNKDKDLSDFENINIPKEVINEILMKIRAKFEDKKLVIRSSATCEDSIFFSGAGQYDSFLNISEDNQIIDAIKRIYSSLFSKNSKLYSSIYNIDLQKESMAVLIQKVAPVVKSGVMFSCNPVDGAHRFIIESTSGLGTGVVEGTGNIKHLEINPNKKNEIDDILIKRLLDILQLIKIEFGYEVDVEWGADKKNNIYIFQTRPIILNNRKFDFVYDKNKVMYRGSIVSKGFTIGKIRAITDSEIGTLLYQNEKYDFNDLELLLKSKGVILKDNSMLSHFANILRELTKPCIHIDNLNLPHDSIYVIDAFKGNLIDFHALDSNDQVRFLLEYFKYLALIYQDIFEQQNGIIKIKEENKYEQVIFGIKEERILKLLKKYHFEKEIITQSIYTFDTKEKSLISGNGIFRIQISNNVVTIQLKRLEMSSKDYRFEEGVILEFSTVQQAKSYMSQLDMYETGFQERVITKYVLGNRCVNIIKWPNCEPYLGVEVLNKEDFELVKEQLELDGCEISGMGGKEIFKKLNLKLENCKF